MPRGQFTRFLDNAAKLLMVVLCGLMGWMSGAAIGAILNTFGNEFSGGATVTAIFLQILILTIACFHNTGRDDTNGGHPTLTPEASNPGIVSRPRGFLPAITILGLLTASIAHHLAPLEEEQMVGANPSAATTVPNHDPTRCECRQRQQDEQSHQETTQQSGSTNEVPPPASPASVPTG